MTTFRGGRLPNDPAKPRLTLSRYLTGPALPAAPAAVNWDATIRSWDVLGNADWGDCALAAEGHTLQTLTANAATEVAPSTADALKAYSEVTGFDPAAGPPGNNPTDQGTVMQDGLNHWRKVGFPVGSTRHKIVAFAEIDVRNTAEMEQAVALFGEILLGIDCPQSALEQFDAGQSWGYVKGSPVEGGHAICSARYDTNSYIPWTVITWGREQRVEQAFMDRYLREAWCVISQEWLSANGSTPSGLDLAAFGADFAALTGQSNPFPNTPPNPPAPPPRSDPLVAAAQALAGDPGVVHWSTQAHLGETKRVAALVRAVIKAAP